MSIEIQRQKCIRCKMNLTFDKFKKKRDDTLMKACIECNIKTTKWMNENKCEEHNRQRNKCKECGGASICVHNRQRSSCKDCDGGSICEHKRQRSTCKECGGNQICEHKRKRSQCKDCGGGSICEHNRQRNKCKDCKDPIKITIKNWIHHSKESDKKHNKFDIVNYIDKCFCNNLVEEYPNCFYCKVELQYIKYQDDLSTIERIDNTIGHIKSNCVLACRKCNYGKVGSK